jgi:hypothetical protein
MDLNYRARPTYTLSHIQILYEERVFEKNWEVTFVFHVKQEL